MLKVALLTGGARGLGFAAAQSLAVDGFAVAIADLDLAACQSAASKLPNPERHTAHQVDVTSEQGMAALFDAVEAKMGPVALLGTFAGILISHGTTKTGIADSTLADWQQTFDVNATGTFLALREMLRRRREKPVENARIITISSLAGQVGGVRGSAPYAASKGAILALTKTAAGEGAPLGLTANCIAPGMIDTKMMRQVVPGGKDDAATENVLLKRVGYPEEIAALVSYLASPAAAFMTGATLDLNGGQLLR